MSKTQKSWIFGIIVLSIFFFIIFPWAARKGAEKVQTEVDFCLKNGAVETYKIATYYGVYRLCVGKDGVLFVPPKQ